MARRPYHKHFHQKVMQRHFLLLSALSLVFVFMIALLTRAELRFSGEVLGAGDERDVRMLFTLQDCTEVTRVRNDAAERLYVVACEPFDYLVKSELSEEGWAVKSVDRLH